MTKLKIRHNFYFYDVAWFRIIETSNYKNSKKRNPFSADDTHIHHLLLKKF